MSLADPAEGQGRAALSMALMLAGIAAGEWAGGFLVGLGIGVCRKIGGFLGYGMEGHRAGTYDLPSRRRKAA